MKKAFVIAVLLLAGASCAEEENKLTGSMSEVYSLEFDDVALVRQGNFVSVEYLSSSGKTAKLVVNLTGIAKVEGTTIDLTEKVGGAPRGTLQRVQTVTTDYPIQRGNIQFDQPPDTGAEVAGRFFTTLTTPAGRTLNGEFKATVTSP